jgi:alpha-1,6-mannosyltransferase
MSALIYLWVLAYGPFRPDRIIPFFFMFGSLFILYAVAVWVVLKYETAQPRLLTLIAGFAVLFNLILLPSPPTLSDDMYRYIWDGHVQAQGINPYRFPSNAPELAYLRDTLIWGHMNRPSAVTVYPPGAQMVFAVLWHLFADSVFAFKVAMVVCVLMSGALLVQLLYVLGQRPERVIIFLWSPLLVFEIAHSGHVDALYLPCVIGALLLRASAPVEKTNIRYEASIGFLLGVAVLTKLYPAILLVPLWSVRDAHGCRRWRLALPVVFLLTVAAGYALYLTPGVDTLGFLSNYTREFFNIGPLPLGLAQWAQVQHIAYYKPTLVLTPLLIGVASLYFFVFPAWSVRQAVMRGLAMIGIYFLVSINLFSWYIIWVLPFTTLDLQIGRWLGWQVNPALAWWLFSGLVALSYHLFVTGYGQSWVSWLEFLPLYAILLISMMASIRTYLRTRKALS